MQEKHAEKKEPVTTQRKVEIGIIEVATGELQKLGIEKHFFLISAPSSLAAVLCQPRVQVHSWGYW